MRGYSDANWASDRNERKSTADYALLISGAVRNNLALLLPQ